MYVLLHSMLLLSMGRPLGPSQDLNELLATARSSFEASPEETIRIAAVGMESFEDSPNESLIELLYLAGMAHQKLARFVDADETYVLAEEMAKEVESTAFEIRILNRRSHCLRMMGEYEAALDILHGLLDEMTERGDDVAIAETLNECAIVNLNRGEIGEAIDLWRASIEIFSDADDWASASLVLGNLGVVHEDLGQFQESIKCIERSMELAESNPGGASRAINLLNLCATYQGLGDHLLAKRHIEEAIELIEPSGSDYDLAAALFHLAAVHHALGEPLQALEVFERVDELYERLGLDMERSRTCTAIAEVLNDLDRSEEALAWSRKSVELSNGIEARSIEVRALQVHANSLESENDLEGATRHRERANALEVKEIEPGVEDKVKLLYLDLENQRREMELLRADAELGRRQEKIDALFVGLIAALAVGASGWAVYSMRQRSHRKLLMSYGALQATNAQLVTREKELQDALARIQSLEGLLPICAACKGIRDADGDWHRLEEYISERSGVRFSHGYCPACAIEAMRHFKT